MDTPFQTFGDQYEDADLLLRSVSNDDIISSLDDPVSNDHSMISDTNAKMDTTSWGPSTWDLMYKTLFKNNEENITSNISSLLSEIKELKIKLSDTINDFIKRSDDLSKEIKDLKTCHLKTVKRFETKIKKVTDRLKNTGHEIDSLKFFNMDQVCINGRFEVDIERLQRCIDESDTDTDTDKNKEDTESDTDVDTDKEDTQSDTDKEDTQSDTDKENTDTDKNKEDTNSDTDKEDTYDDKDKENTTVNDKSLFYCIYGSNPSAEGHSAETQMIQLVYRDGKYYTRINDYYHNKQTEDIIEELCLKIDNSLIPKDFNQLENLDIDSYEYYTTERYAYSSEYWLDISKIESIYGSNKSDPFDVYYCYYNWIVIFLQFSETEKNMFNIEIHQEIESSKLEKSFEKLTYKYKKTHPSWH